MAGSPRLTRFALRWATAVVIASTLALFAASSAVQAQAGARSAGPAAVKPDRSAMVSERRKTDRRRHRGRRGPAKPQPASAPTPTAAPSPVSAPTPKPAPAPAPVPSGAPAGYKLFFEDEFDKGSLANFVQGSDNTGKINVDKATGTATFTLPAETSSPRVELSIHKPDQHFTEGMQFVLELERRLAPGTAPAVPGQHFTIAQFKGREGRFPMISEEYGNFSQGTALYLNDKNRTPIANYKVANYSLGAWHTHRMYVSVSKVKRGGYAFTVDGAQVASVSGINTLESVDSYGFLKIGAYGQPGGKAVELKLRNIRLYVPA